MEKSLDYDYIFKYILIGDASVGKSTILNMFVNQSFLSESNPTMGVQFATKKLVIDGLVIKVQIWDTAGQQSFRTITRAYYKNAIGIILVYDLNNPDSLRSIESWLKEIHDNSNEAADIIIVGNKSDIVSPPNVSPKPNIPFITTSAKTGSNIKKLFNTLSQTILQKIKTGKINIDSVPGIKKGNSSPNKNIKLFNEKGEREDGKNQQNKRCCG